MADLKVSVLNDFSEYPGPRYSNQGEHSGEEFYHSIINKKFATAVVDKSTLEVNLDGTAGYASSFLDEAFGNLVYDFGESIVKNHLVIVSTQEPDWIDMLEKETYPQWEERRKQNNSPKYTTSHNSKFVYNKGEVSTIDI